MNCERLGDRRENFSPASSLHTARAVFPEPADTGDLLREKGAALSDLQLPCALQLSESCAQEPQQSRRARDAPQTGLPLRTRVSELNHISHGEPAMHPKRACFCGCVSQSVKAVAAVCPLERSRGFTLLWKGNVLYSLKKKNFTI